MKILNFYKNSHALIILSICLATFLTILDAYIVNIAMPAIAGYYKVDIALAARVGLIYLLIMTSTLLLFGKLADSYGYKKCFIFGYIIFTIGSFLCGLAPSFNLLLLARCVQAIGGSILNAMVAALIANLLPLEKRLYAFGLVTVFSTLGISVGSPVGGIICSYLNWRWIFWVNVPIGIFAIILAQRILPPDKTTARGVKASFDIPGAILSFCGLALMLYAINSSHELGLTSRTIWGCAASGILLLGIFVWRELHHSDPLLNFNLFKNKPFTYLNLATFCVAMFIAGSNFLLPFYLINAKGLSEKWAGMVMLIFSIANGVAGAVSNRVAKRISVYRTMNVSMIIAALANFAFAFTLHLPGFYSVVTTLVILGITFGITHPITNTLSMNFSPPDKRGMASAVFRTTIFVGCSCGICLFEGIAAHTAPTANVLTMDSEALLKAAAYAYSFGALICAASLIFINLSIPKKAAD